MSRRLLVLPFVVCVMWLVAPDTAMAQAVPGDSVTGRGGACVTETCDGFESVSVEAHSGPAGENPQGRASWNWRFGAAGGEVTCLSVTGRVAIIGLAGFEDEFIPIGTFAGLIRIVDGGGPGSQLDSWQFDWQRATLDEPPLTGPTTCSAFPAGFAPQPSRQITITEGDFTVIDSPSLPTSKDQCKNGGWRNFPGFKNEGLCVAFVQRGVKPTP